MGKSLFFLITGVIFIIFSLYFLSTEGVDASSIVILIAGLVFTPIGFLGVKFVNLTNEEKRIVNDPERKENAFQKWISDNLEEYNVSMEDIVSLETGNRYYILKPEIKKFIFFKYRGRYLDKIKEVEDNFDHIIIDLNIVRTIQLMTNEIVLGEVTKENGIGRALVGGVLFGAAGAIKKAGDQYVFLPLHN